ncbi:MAG: DUF4150 domain-containing protein [Sandaracinaceae bacterium]|nr:DUF4150 domain-containing protein [Sandaracinaceae bacterium]
MFPASTDGGGQATAVPDVCKVPAPPGPPVPTPFPNIAMLNQADGSTCSSRVRILNRKACTTRTEVSRTSGDEAGTLKGMVSSTTMDKATFKSGSMKVTIEGADAVRHMSPTAHNGSNANAPAGSQLSPSQTKVILHG